MPFIVQKAVLINLEYFCRLCLTLGDVGLWPSKIGGSQRKLRGGQYKRKDGSEYLQRGSAPLPLD